MEVATDRETLQNMVNVTVASGELNEISQPLGYAVTHAACGTLGNDDVPEYQRFTVHRVDKPVAHGPSFNTVEQVREHLDALANLPCWRLDLDDPSVEFDDTELSIKDTESGESFSLKGWGPVVTGRAKGGRAGSYDGARHLSVRSDEPPTIGKWYKSDTALQSLAGRELSGA